MALARFVPQTKPTAAMLNAIGDSQTSIEGGYIGAAQEPGSEQWSGGGSSWGFIHLFRWLLYRSTGNLEDPTGVNADVALSEDEDLGYGILDLDTVSWLAYGAYYVVTGVNGAVERRTPAVA